MIRDDMQSLQQIKERWRGALYAQMHLFQYVSFLYVASDLGLLIFCRSDDILSTPQWQQQQACQAYQQRLQNTNTSPLRWLPLARPETPSPSPHHIESARTNKRLSSWLTRENELQSSPRRRRTIGIQNENVPSPASTRDNRIAPVSLSVFLYSDWSHI